MLMRKPFASRNVNATCFVFGCARVMADALTTATTFLTSRCALVVISTLY